MRTYADTLIMSTIVVTSVVAHSYMSDVVQCQSLRVVSDYCDANALVYRGGGYAELPFVTAGEKVAEFINLRF